MAARTQAFGDGFGAQLRSWRRCRKLSQLELALAADVSQRHVSWLETGRSRPSRSMVLRLADALAIPLREQNMLLTAAGFAAVYAELSIDTPAMAPVTEALERMLQHHEPYPAIVADRHWNVLRTNRAMDRLLAKIDDRGDLWERVGDDGRRNLARLTLHPDGLRPLIANWREAAPIFVQRLRREALATGVADDLARVEALARLAGLPEAAQAEPAPPLLPTLPLELRAGPLRLALFSVISTFGTPQDITTDELRVESFFPADRDTERLLRALAAAPV